MVAVADNDLVCAGVEYESEQAPVPLTVSSVAEIPSVIQPVVSVSSKSFVPSEVLDFGNNVEGEIPGLDSSSHSGGLAETPIVSSLVPTDSEDASQEQATSLGGLTLELMPSISTDRSEPEELSPKAITEASSINSSIATSVGLSTQLVLPKMSAPVIDLSDEEKDQLQKLAFSRIVEASKQIATAGGSYVRFSLLGCLGIEVTIST